MNDTDLLAAIGRILDEKLIPLKKEVGGISDYIFSIREELVGIKDQLKEIDTSIGMLADWAESVAAVTNVTFASGKAQ